MRHLLITLFMLLMMGTSADAAVWAKMGGPVAATPTTCNVGTEDVTSFVSMNINPAYSSIVAEYSTGTCSGTAKKAYLYLDDFNGTTQQFSALIYDSSDNLCAEIEYVGAAFSDPAWIEVDISSANCTITASTTIKLGLHGEYAWSKYYRNASGSTVEYNSGASFGDVPDPWSADGTIPGSIIGMYIEVEP